MGKLLDAYMNRFVSYLAQEGRKVINRAIATQSVKFRSYNLMDAFGFVVYHNGIVKTKGYGTQSPKSKGTHRGWEKHGIPDGTGRGWLDDFISGYEPPKTGFTLVVVNAAFYARILEEGMQGPPAGHPARKKYRIISQTVGMMEDIQSKFKGSALTLQNVHK